jgi:pimeloyl-ACP methyl ester carboxylesterase
MVSAQLAGTRPDLVRRAFLEDPPVWFDRLRFLAETWLRFDPDAITPLLDGSGFDGFDRTRPITCPVRLLRADPAMASFRPGDEAPFLATHPRAAVALVEASHLIHMEHPERFLTEVQAFLADE